MEAKIFWNSTTWMCSLLLLTIFALNIGFIVGWLLELSLYLKNQKVIIDCIHGARGLNV